MRTTLNIEDNLIDKASKMTGIFEGWECRVGKLAQ